MGTILLDPICHELETIPGVAPAEAGTALPSDPAGIAAFHAAYRHPMAVRATPPREAGTWAPAEAASLPVAEACGACEGIPAGTWRPFDYAGAIARVVAPAECGSTPPDVRS